MEVKTKICCLPKAGNENPYQQLMMKGLASSDNNIVKHGVVSKFFPFIKTAFKFKPDYLHLDWLESYYIRRSGWMTIVNWPFFILDIVLVSVFTKTRFVCTLHNIVPHNKSHRKRGIRAYKIFLRRCDWVRVFDQSTIKKVIDLYGLKKEKLVVVPEGSYKDYYSQIKHVETVWNNDSESTSFLYLGLIKPYKGIVESIKEFKKLSKLNWEYKIVGKCISNNYENEILQAIGDDVRITFINKYVDDNEVKNYYDQTDIVILPFRKIENSGSVILAMGFGKVVIAPKIGVLNSRLSNQTNLLYEDSIVELEDEIIRLNKSDIERIGKLNSDSLDAYKWENFSQYFVKK